MEPSRWGIIYCPKDGVRHIHKEWEAIRSYLTEKGVLYDFVQSEGPKSVERQKAHGKEVVAAMKEKAAQWKESMAFLG